MCFEVYKCTRDSPNHWVTVSYRRLPCALELVLNAGDQRFELRNEALYKRSSRKFGTSEIQIFVSRLPVWGIFTLTLPETGRKQINFEVLVNDFFPVRAPVST